MTQQDLIAQAKAQLADKKFLALKKTIGRLKKVSPKVAIELELMADLEQGRLSGLEEKLDKYLADYEEVPYDNLVAAAKIKCEKEKFAEAIEYCHRAINLADQLPQAPEMLYACYQNMGKGEEARKVVDALITKIGPHQRYLEWQIITYASLPLPDVVIKAWEAIQQNYSVDDTVEKAGVFAGIVRAYALLGRIEEAKALIASDISIGANREDPQVRLSLCEVLRWTGDTQEWADEMIRLADDYPDNTEAHWNSALALLAAGRITEGWKRYEIRWQWDEFPSPKRKFHVPRWSGQDLDGKSILIWAEQGVGDQMMFLNTLPEIFDLGPNEVIIEVVPKLVKIVSAWYPEAVVRENGPLIVGAETDNNYSTIDYQIPSGSLPLHFFSSEEQIKGAKRRFLNVSEKKREALLGEYAQKYTKIIGLAWRSSLLTTARQSLYLNVAAMANLIEKSPPGVGFVSLQYGLSDEERETLLATGRVLIPAEDFYDDVYANGMYTGCCDLAIATGSANLILAGMFGVPAIGWGDKDSWVLLGQKQHPWFPNIYQIMCMANWDKGAVVRKIAERLDQVYGIWGLK